MMRRMRAVAVVVAAVAILLGIWGSNVQMARAEMSPTECKQERKIAGNACQPVLYGKSPSAECCQHVRLTHLECVCPYVSPKVASIIRSYGLNKLVKQIEGCGRTLPHSFNCGSITLP